MGETRTYPANLQALQTVEIDGLIFQVVITDPNT
jgi:hypothetical protein